MKKVEAIIRPFKLDEVKAALAAVGVQGMTVTEVRGYGGTRDEDHVAAPAYTADYVPKAQIEVIVPDEMVRGVIETIEESAVTGRVGGGKIFITPVEEVLRIRTGERGKDAV
jgi:nitrogen regulatory protein P-II 1